MGSLYIVRAVAVVADWDYTNFESRFGYAVVRCELDDTRSENTLRLSVISGAPIQRRKYSKKLVDSL